MQQPEKDLVEPEGVNAGAADAVVDAEVGGGGGGGGGPGGGGTADDVLGGGQASKAEEQQSNEEHPSPLGGSPWQDPDAPDEKAYSGDR